MCLVTLNSEILEFLILMTVQMQFLVCVCTSQFGYGEVSIRVSWQSYHPDDHRYILTKLLGTTLCIFHHHVASRFMKILRLLVVQKDPRSGSNRVLFHWNQTYKIKLLKFWWILVSVSLRKIYHSISCKRNYEKISFLVKVISVFVTRTFVKSRTEINAILWFFEGYLTIKTTF